MILNGSTIEPNAQCRKPSNVIPHHIVFVSILSYRKAMPIAHVYSLFLWLREGQRRP